MDCLSCGAAPNRPDQRFCAKCGTNLAPVEPPAAYGHGTRITGPLFADDVPTAPPAPPPPPPRLPPSPGPPPPPPPYAVAPPPTSYDAHQGSRRRSPVVLLAVAALFAALIGAAGVVLLFGGHEDSPSDTSAEDRADGPGDVTDKTDGGSSAPSRPGPTETQSSKPSTFRCWNGGRAVARLGSCTPAFGAAGMAWVLPSSTGATCTLEAGAQRASEAECMPTVGDDTVRFHYSEWRTRAALETYYGGNTVGGIGSPSGRDDLTAVQVESRDRSVGYKVAIYYADSSALWSVTIYAGDEAQYQAAVDQLVMRPFRRLSGEPVGR